MALILTPEQQQAGSAVLGGPAAGAPAAVPGFEAPGVPAAGPAPAMPGALPLGGRETGGMDALALTPPPRLGGVSEGFAAQIGRASEKLGIPLKADGSPVPGGWARSLVGAAQASLAGVGAIGQVPAGAGALYGIGKVMGAQQAHADEMRQEAAKQKQQDFENDMKVKEFKQKEELQHSDTLLRQIQIHSALRDADHADQEAELARSKPWHDSMMAAGAKDIEGATDLTSSEIQAVAKQHGSPDDPNGIKWLESQNRRQTGFRDVVGRDGDPIPKLDDKGNPTGVMQREPTFTLMTWGDPEKLTQAQVDQANKYRMTGFKVGDILKPMDARAFDVQIGLEVQKERVMLDAAVAAGTDEEKLAEFKDKAGLREAGKLFLPWMIDAKNDPNLALSNMKAASEEIGANGQPTEHAVEVKKQYDQVVQGLGQKIVDKDIDTFQKEQIEKIKADTAAAVKKLAGPQGDTSLSGEAYLNSIPDHAHRALIKLVDNNQFPVQRWDYMFARGSSLPDEISLYDPNFNGLKAKEAPDMYKDFISGPASKALNAGGTAMESLDRLATLATPRALIPTSSHHKEYEDQLVTTATEVQKFLIGGAGQPTEGQVKDMENALRSNTPWGMQAAIKQQAKATLDKLGNYQQQWANGLPNPRWNTPMPTLRSEVIAIGERLAGEKVRTQPSATPSAPTISPKTIVLTDGAHQYNFQSQEQADAAMKKYPQLKGAQ